MADLLAKQQSKPLTLNRGQEVEGHIIAILPQEVIFDLGTKAEGVLPKKDLSADQIATLKVGDTLLTYVIQTEGESNQVILGLQRAVISSNSRDRGGRNNSSYAQRNAPKWKKFEDLKSKGSTLKGKVMEVNKGGLIVEIDGVRGFLPTSQVALSAASNLDEMVDKDVDVVVIEVDASQNRLILSQKTKLTDEAKTQLSSLKVGDKVKGTVAAVMPFGVFVSLEGGVEGLVHVSEISWDKVEDPASFYKAKDEVEAEVISVDQTGGRVNLSVKKLTTDPFTDKIKDLQPDDVLKATVTKVSSQGIFVTLEGGIEGVIPSSKMEGDGEYEVGKSLSVLVDSIDNQKRRVNLAPFITSTKDLIYK